MNKAAILVLLALMAALSFGKVSSFANENDDLNKLKFNNAINLNGDSNIFQTSGEGKNKTQFRIKNSHDGEDSEFMIKGVITASSSDSITIDGKVINIDPLVTDEVKIVGELQVGAYAMAKGEVNDSAYFAEKIVVDQRNKKDIEEEEDEIDEDIDDQDENASPSATPTPTIGADDDEDENATMTAQLDFGNIINVIQNFLNFLRDIASKI
jgi:hypothetical protein